MLTVPHATQVNLTKDLFRDAHAVEDFITAGRVRDISDYKFQNRDGDHLMQELLKDSTSVAKFASHSSGEQALRAVFDYVQHLADAGHRRVPPQEMIDRLKKAIEVAENLFNQPDLNVRGMVFYGGALRGKSPEDFTPGYDKLSQDFDFFIVTCGLSKERDPINPKNFIWLNKVLSVADRVSRESSFYKDEFGTPYRYASFPTVYPFVGDRNDKGQIEPLKLKYVTSGPYLAFLPGDPVKCGEQVVCGPPRAFFNSCESGLGDRKR